MRQQLIEENNYVLNVTEVFTYRIFVGLPMSSMLETLYLSLIERKKDRKMLK